MGGWKAVVFDLDGTLTDTLGDLAAATNEALRRHGFPACPLESYRHMVGNGARKLIERALGGACTPERTEQVLQDFLKIYDADCPRYTRPYDGVEEALAFFRAKGVRMAVVTNKPEKPRRGKSSATSSAKSFPRYTAALRNAGLSRIPARFGRCSKSWASSGKRRSMWGTPTWIS